MTVLQLQEALEHACCQPAAEGQDLVILGDEVPDHLEAPLELLFTGLLAMYRGCAWLGCDGSTGAIETLNPGQPIPQNVTLLASANTEEYPQNYWHRISAGVRRSLPKAFE
jgi:hypothetical protein